MNRKKLKETINITGVESSSGSPFRELVRRCGRTDVKHMKQ